MVPAAVDVMLNAVIAIVAGSHMDELVEGALLKAVLRVEVDEDAPQPAKPADMLCVASVYQIPENGVEVVEAIKPVLRFTEELDAMLQQESRAEQPHRPNSFETSGSYTEHGGNFIATHDRVAGIGLLHCNLKGQQWR